MVREVGKMKRFPLILMLVMGFFAASMSPVDEIDLSFFLKPGKWRVLFAPDFRGDVFIAQPGCENIVKISSKGRVLWTGPLEKGGRVVLMDTTAEGDLVVIMERGKEALSQGKASWALIFYDSETLGKKKEIPLSKLSAQGLLHLTDFKVLKPEDKLLIRGTFRTNNSSLHLFDFDGKYLFSFSEIEGGISAPAGQADVLSPGYLAVDCKRRIIYQIFPVSCRIKAFDYNGNLIAEGSYPKRAVTKIVVNGERLILEYFPQTREGGFYRGSGEHSFLQMEIRGKKIELLPERIDYRPDIGGLLIGSDGQGNFYFLSGKTRQLLRVCRIEQGL